MVFLSWNRPTPDQQQSSINKSSGFNYDPKYISATSSHHLSHKDLAADGFHLNHAKVLLGSGPDVFNKAKNVLQSWRHFGFDWAFVQPKTKIEKGVKFCVCCKEIIPWVIMPLQVVYVEQTHKASDGGGGQEACFGYGSGTLNGHLLAGEERFSIKLDENNQVWYEILSISKPAHLLSHITYPYVKLRQKYFASESAKAVLKHVSSD